MAVWEHLNVDNAHVAYAILGVFAALFSLISLFVKEKLYIGEATVAAIVGLIVGPHCLNWFSPTEWGNSDYITLEVSRIVLCLQIFAVAVELPKKYMLKHWKSVFMLLVPVMTAGWLVIGLFTWLLFRPRVNFAEALVVSACVTATDPVLAAAVVGKGKFARRVPGHLRNILSAESGCNDGMAFPFIYLGINLVIHAGNAGEIVKDWICVTILYECVFGCLFGAIIGYLGRHAIKYAEKKKIIDRESFLAFYFFLAFTCAGFGSILGVDDLLVSFAAGAAFAWDGWFARSTEESHVSTVIDLLLNLSYFVYFGAIIPWEQFNNPALGLNVWRLIVLAIVMIFLRRIPAVLAFKHFIPDIKSWREALFCGHFGPVGVGAVFAAILARAELEGAAHPSEATPLSQIPSEESEYGHLIAIVWPIVSFLIITSIIVHGSSVAVITLGKHLNTMAISMTFTTTNGNEKSSSWMARLPDLKGGRSFSLQRVDTQAPSTSSGSNAGQLSQSATIETSGVPVRPAGGMERRRKKKRRGLKRVVSHHDDDVDREKLQREKEAKAASFALGGNSRNNNDLPEHNEEGSPRIGITPKNTFTAVPFPSEPQHPETLYEHDTEEEEKEETTTSSTNEQGSMRGRRPTNAYQEGKTLIVEDQHGEVMDTARLVEDRHEAEELKLKKSRSNSSSLTSVMSPRIDSLTGHTNKQKCVAYQIGDHLIIENLDGEIVRRYKMNHHRPSHDVSQSEESSALNSASRSRSTTLISEMTGKALSAVGLKKALSHSSAGSSSPMSPTKKTAVSNLMSAPIRENKGEEEEDDDDVDDDEEEEDDDDYNTDDASDNGDDEQETAIERQRRLAALGQVPGERDESDEEETPVKPTTAASTRSKMSTLVGGLMPHAITEESVDDGKKSITFQDTPKPRR